MDRKEVCQKIRDLNLQDAVKQHYGDNYTRVSTDKLIKLVEAYDKPAKKAPAPKKEEAPKPEAKKPAEEPAKKSALEKVSIAEVGSVYEAACLVFLSLLKDNGLLDNLLKKL
jgi:hypothetical protein